MERLTRIVLVVALAAVPTAGGASAATSVLLGEIVTCDASASEGHPSSYAW